jgi:hypothetical protein
MSWFKISGTEIDFRATCDFVSSIDAAEITVKQIIANYPPPYRLMVSGGVDSQAMLWAWKQFGRDFIPTSVVYNDQFNEYDLAALKEFALRENIEIEYIDFNLFDFYESRFPYIADKFQCTSPQFATHLGFAENLDGTKIFSGDRLLKHRAIVNHANICLYRASQEWSIVPYFFLETPELAYSMIFDLKNDPLKGSRPADMYEEKVKIWQDTGFPVIAQEQKFNGFEKIKEHYQQNRRDVLTPKLRIKFKSVQKLLEPVVYDVLFRHPYEEKFGTPEYTQLITTIDQQLNKNFITRKF